MLETFVRGQDKAEWFEVRKAAPRSRHQLYKIASGTDSAEKYIGKWELRLRVRGDLIKTPKSEIGLVAFTQFLCEENGKHGVYRTRGNIASSLTIILLVLNSITTPTPRLFIT